MRRSGSTCPWFETCYSQEKIKFPGENCKRCVQQVGEVNGCRCCSLQNRVSIEEAEWKWIWLFTFCGWPFAEHRTRAYDNYPKALQDLQSRFGKKCSLENELVKSILNRTVRLKTKKGIINKLVPKLHLLEEHKAFSEVQRDEKTLKVRRS